MVELCYIAALLLTLTLRLFGNASFFEEWRHTLWGVVLFSVCAWSVWEGQYFSALMPIGLLILPLSIWGLERCLLYAMTLTLWGAHLDSITSVIGMTYVLFLLHYSVSVWRNVHSKQDILQTFFIMTVMMTAMVIMALLHQCLSMKVVLEDRWSYLLCALYIPFIAMPPFPESKRSYEYCFDTQEMGHWILRICVGVSLFFSAQVAHIHFVWILVFLACIVTYLYKRGSVWEQMMVCGWLWIIASFYTVHIIHACFFSALFILFFLGILSLRRYQKWKEASWLLLCSLYLQHMCLILYVLPANTLLFGHALLYVSIAFTIFSICICFALQGYGVRSVVRKNSGALAVQAALFFFFAGLGVFLLGKGYAL
ncbi:MAG: hypothetical protein OXC30_01745 [Alphaproteobacteria bacterium]|nr:hypothetical protein [Alphaproteobacteria bacterium]